MVVVVRMRIAFDTVHTQCCYTLSPNDGMPWRAMYGNLLHYLSIFCVMTACYLPHILILCISFLAKHVHHTNTHAHAHTHTHTHTFNMEHRSKYKYMYNCVYTVQKCDDWDGRKIVFVQLKKYADDDDDDDGNECIVRAKKKRMELTKTKEKMRILYHPEKWDW